MLQCKIQPPQYLPPQAHLGMNSNSNHAQDWLRLAELPRAGLELGHLITAAPWLSLAPQGDGHPVMVIPGFLADDDSTRILRHFVGHLGYSDHVWGQGRNLGAARMGGYEPLVKQVLRLYRKTGQQVSLIGWSLGGVHAAAVAQRAGYAVRQVVTLGSPLLYGRDSTVMLRALQATARALNSHLHPPPAGHGGRQQDSLYNVRLPVTSIFSRTDGVVPWQRSWLPAGPQRDNVEVFSSHIGLGFNASVLFVVADRLAQSPTEFTPFHRRGWRAWVYPNPEAENPPAV